MEEQQKKVDDEIKTTIAQQKSAQSRQQNICVHMRHL